MTVKLGDHVKVEYEGKLDDGSVFDTSKHGDHSHPLEFRVGSGEVIAGFDNGMIGMQIGEEKTIIIEPEQAYGQHEKRLVKTFPRAMLPSNDKLEEGMELIMQTPQGQEIPAFVTDLDEESVTLDLNHPLAGKRLHFTVTLLEIIS